jgi:biopolymer transport protein ExbB/TolQ
VNVDRIIQLLQDGGLTVYPLGLCSLVAVGIFIDRLFRFRGQMTESRSLTQNVVNALAAGISEALVATAAGLGVAILALMAYNYLQVRIGAIAGSYARSCERLVQVVLYVESGGKGPQAGTPSESGQ